MEAAEHRMSFASHGFAQFLNLSDNTRWLILFRKSYRKQKVNGNWKLLRYFQLVRLMYRFTFVIAFTSHSEDPFLFISGCLVMWDFPLYALNTIG